MIFSESCWAYLGAELYKLTKAIYREKNIIIEIMGSYHNLSKDVFFFSYLLVSAKPSIRLILNKKLETLNNHMKKILSFIFSNPKFTLFADN